MLFVHHAMPQRHSSGWCGATKAIVKTSICQHRSLKIKAEG
jgi:hypothetical protein